MKTRVLVVDNEPWMRSLLVDYLELEGYDVQAAYDLETTRNLLGAYVPDVMILDIVLPDGNGLNFLKEMKDKPETQSVPVIMISAHHTKVEDKLTSFQMGADDYLLKPFDLKEMLRRIDRVLKRLDVVQGKPEEPKPRVSTPVAFPQLENTLKALIDQEPGGRVSVQSTPPPSSNSIFKTLSGFFSSFTRLFRRSPTL